MPHARRRTPPLGRQTAQSRHRRRLSARTSDVIKVAGRPLQPARCEMTQRLMVAGGGRRQIAGYQSGHSLPSGQFGLGSISFSLLPNPLLLNIWKLHLMDTILLLFMMTKFSFRHRCYSHFITTCATPENGIGYAFAVRAISLGAKPRGRRSHAFLRAGAHFRG